MAAGAIAATLVLSASLAWVSPVDHDAVAANEPMPLAEVEARVLALFEKRIAPRVTSVLRTPRDGRGAKASVFEDISVEVASGRAVGSGTIRGRWTIAWTPGLPDGTTEEQGDFAADVTWRLTRWPWPALSIDSVRYRSELFCKLLDLVPIPAGEFLMGSAEDDPEARNSERPRHRQIVEGFALARTPTTCLQWAMVMGGTPPAEPDKPKVDVSWFDAVEFCQALARLGGLPTAYAKLLSSGEASYELKAKSPRDGFRLPTESEWEYACRAGTTTSYSFGDDPGQLGEHAWYRPRLEGPTDRSVRSQPTRGGFTICTARLGNGAGAVGRAIPLPMNVARSVRAGCCGAARSASLAVWLRSAAVGTGTAPGAGSGELRFSLCRSVPPELGYRCLILAFGRPATLVDNRCDVDSTENLSTIAGPLTTTYLTLPEAAALLGRSERQIRYLIQQGKLHAKKQGRRWLVDKSAIDGLPERQRRHAQRLETLEATVRQTLSLPDGKGTPKWSILDAGSASGAPISICPMRNAPFANGYPSIGR